MHNVQTTPPQQHIEYYFDVYAMRLGSTPENEKTTPEEPDWDRDPSTQLSPKGIAEAQKLHEFFKNIKIDYALRSNTECTKQTAEYALAGKDIKIEVSPGLEDMDLGAEEIKQFSGLKTLPPSSIVAAFNAITGYNSEESKSICPRVWEVLEGAPIPITNANLCYYDEKVFKKADTFDGYKERTVRFLDKTIVELQKQGLSSLACIGHSTLIKAFISESMERPMDSVKPLNGAWVHIRMDSKGNWHYVGSQGIQFKPLKK